MKFLNKLISFILCLVLIVNSSSVVYGAEVIDDSDGVHLYSVPVESNEYLKDSVTFYEFDGKYYLSLEDVKDFTRCTLTEDEEIITLTHGLREIVIDKSTGHMTDSDIVDQGNIILLEYDGEYLCEGIPMLIYLGATCTISEHNKLEVLMPVFTIWESIMPDYLDYYFNINELYGGEDNVKISLICDIIADVLDGVSGHGLMANADTHLEDALYEILNVDMMKYASVQETASAQNQKINDFLSSAVFGTMLDTGDNMYDAVYEALDYYSRFYVSAKNDILLDMMTQTDDLDYASELASQIKEQVYAQSATKANLKNAKKAQSFMDIGMLAFDTAITSYSMMQYNDDTKNLFARTINREMFEYANYYDISWNNVSDKISNTLKSTQSIVANTAIDNVAEFAVEKVTEEGAKTALSAFTSKANIYTAAIQIGSFIASLINYESNQAFSADMNAIWLSAVQYDVAMLVSSLLVKERDEFQFSSAESLEKLKDMFTLYYRTTIAFSENIAKSIEEFGTKSNQKWVPWFSSTTEASVGNYAAAYLYRITNCTIVPVVDYAGLSDTLIKADWIKQYEKRQDSERGNSIGNIANGGLVAQSGDWIYYQHTNDGFTLYKMRVDGSEKTKLNDNISYCINVVEDWIYYINNSDFDAQQRIYKIRTDGSENTKLNDSMSEDVNVIGDWIYYKKYCGNGDWKLHKLSLDGSQEIMLYDKGISDFCVTNDWIYFTDYEGGGEYSLCKIRTDGSEKTKLINENAYDINIEGDWIYYTVGGLEDKVIRKIRTDGTGETKVNSDGSFHLNVIGDWIYYSNWNDGSKLYKIRTDGSQNTKLTDDDSVHIHIIDEWIYYTIDFGNGELYRIRTDGTDRQIITQ